MNDVCSVSVQCINVVGDYLYSGLGDGVVMRVSLSAQRSIKLAFELTPGNLKLFVKKTIASNGEDSAKHVSADDDGMDVDEEPALEESVQSGDGVHPVQAEKMHHGGRRNAQLSGGSLRNMSCGS